MFYTRAEALTEKFLQALDDRHGIIVAENDCDKTDVYDIECTDEL